MQANTIRRLFTCAAVALFIAACSRDPKPGTPEAAVAGERFMRLMSDTLANSETFTFETSERMEVIGPSGEKEVLHFTRKTTVRRPNALFFEIHWEGDTAIEINAYYDGRTLSLLQEPDGAWAQTTVPETLDGMLDDVARRFGLPVPIGDVVYSSPYDAFIGSSTRGGFAGRETIDGVPYVKLDYADDLVEVRLWLPTSGPALPRRLEIVYKQALTPLVTQLNFTSWQLDVPVTDAMFAFQPPADRDPIEFGDFVTGVVSRTLPSGQQAASPAAPGAKPAGEPAAP
jgi:hypothetical protein